MNKKQYNNIIDWTLKHDKVAQTHDCVSTARAIFNNMGVALPQGSCAEIADVLKSDDYMGWKSCTAEEAQDAANNGTAAIGIRDDRMIVLSANDDEPITETGTVMTLSNAISSDLDMKYYVYINNTTIHEKKAIVIVPGIACSSLQNDRGQKVWFWLGRQSQLACDENGKSINNISSYNPDNYGVRDNYQNLYSSLESKYHDEYEIIFFDYDWRMSCATAAKELEDRLCGYDSCILVAHSMGGIVASSYLTRSSTNRNKVSKLITIGTPYMGAPKALYVIETGNLIQNTDFILHLSDYALNIPAIYELLPTKRYLDIYSWYINNNGSYLNGYSNSTDFLKTCDWAKKEDGTPKPMFDEATEFHDSLLINGVFVTNRSDVDTYVIYGVGNETIMGVAFDENGEYDYYYYADHGDGTVPLYSALNQGEVGDDKTYSFNEEHVGLIKNSQCIQTIENIIDGVSSAATNTKTRATNMIKSSVLAASKLKVDTVDEKKITIVANQFDNICIKTNEGYEIHNKGEELYYDYNGENYIVGRVWKIKDKSYQYILTNGEYMLYNMNAIDSSSTIRIDYCNYGLSESVRKFDNISVNDVISIDKFDNSNNTVQGIKIVKK